MSPISTDDREVTRLINVVLDLAAGEGSPVADKPPMSVIVSALVLAVDHPDDAATLKAALVGVLAWIARQNWAEVMNEVRSVEGGKLQ